MSTMPSIFNTTRIKFIFYCKHLHWSGKLYVFLNIKCSMCIQNLFYVLYDLTPINFISCHLVIFYLYLLFSDGRNDWFAQSSRLSSSRGKPAELSRTADQDPVGSVMLFPDLDPEIILDPISFLDKFDKKRTCTLCCAAGAGLFSWSGAGEKAPDPAPGCCRLA